MSRSGNWRAVARLRGREGREEALLYVGDTKAEVEENWKTAVGEVLAPEVYPRVNRVAIQQWNGSSNSGRWKDDSEVVLSVAPRTKPATPPEAPAE